YLGDSDYFPVPVSELMDSTYLAERIKDFNFYRITPGISSGIINVYEPGETTHYSVVDKDRNAVAVTTTLNDSFGSRVVVAGSGFFLNNEMDDFSIKPGFRNLFGLTGGKANAIEPGKRMLSSMTPSIIEKDGELYFVLGSPGGSRIITTVFQVILNVINNDMTLPDAVSAPRFHHQGIPDTLFYEYPRISGPAMEALRQMNYFLIPVESMGRVNAILVNGSTLAGAADPRGDDGAAGF
ncbi:MAG TPA: gamma-glutamyltransferase, partial [Cyclobacteriaceae bacterium]|nr:gamma-glutamyltransferase [Cyclobacteriaceae bacterium]